MVADEDPAELAARWIIPRTRVRERGPAARLAQQPLRFGGDRSLWGHAPQRLAGARTAPYCWRMSVPIATGTRPAVFQVPG
jgi:hypothetical protein